MTRFAKLIYLIVMLSLLVTLASCDSGVSEVTYAPQQTDAPQTDIPHVHSFIDEVTPASCINEGKIVEKCSCGETKDELVIPKISHMATEINCESETLCGVCGAVIAPATGHKMLVSEVISKATCTADGKAIYICSICGKEEELISARVAHSFDSSTKWSVSNGVYSASSGCAFCGTSRISESDIPAFSLDFESSISDIATKYEGFRIVKPNNYDSKTVEANGSVGLKVVGSTSSIFYIDADAEKLLEMGMFSISFDMTLLTDGTSGKEPSLFSLLGDFQNGATTGSTIYRWMFKFKTDESKIETVQGKPLNDTNSAFLEKGVKHQINILLNTQTGKAEIFVNGRHIGASQNNYVFIKDDAQNQNLSFRFGDGNMPETIFDNIRISTVR